MPQSAFRLTLCVALPTLILSACGGGGGDGGTEAPSFQELGDTFDRLYAPLLGEDNPISVTPPEMLPKSRARYEGAASYVTEGASVSDVFDNPDARSTVTLEADFDNEQMSGEFSQFVLADGTRIPGILRLEEGTPIEDALVQGVVKGRLGTGTSESEIEADLVAGFFGDEGEGIAGDLRFVGDVPALGGGAAYGIFVAER